MKYKKIIISLIGFFVIMTACQEDWLDRTPLDQITEADFLKQPDDFTTYVNRFHTIWTSWSGDTHGDIGSDIQIRGNSIPDRIGGNSTINSGPGYSYGNVRRVNYLIVNAREYEGDFNDIKQAVGEAHYFRAYYYFSLLQNFGDVQWIGNVLGTTSEELYGSRDPRNFIADKIIADLDTAAMYLRENRGNGIGRLNKWNALHLQSRVALFEGCWEKYHSGTPFGVNNADPNKYFEKAASACNAIIGSDLYSVYTTGDPANDYYNNFNWRDYTNHPEAMRWTKVDLDLGISAGRKLYITAVPNERGFTKDLVDQYLCTDGQPIAVSPLYQGDATIADEVMNRDPRFDQTIFTADNEWYISPDGSVRYYQECFDGMFTTQLWTTPTGYCLRKFYDAHTIYHDTQNDETPTMNERYGEVLLNYAEAKAELGTITQADLDKSINVLRARVGMPDLMLINITADPNWRWPELSPIINEVRRERLVELAWEGFRFDDLLRWAAMDKFVDTRPRGAKGDQFPNPHNMPVDENGYLDPYQNAFPSGYQFNLNRDYLWPIKESEHVLNPNLGQNPGWEN
jgi:starch-binding outer membrane protein, SusD/RagB family